eukprot:g2271.t1
MGYNGSDERLGLNFDYLKYHESRGAYSLMMNVPSIETKSFDNSLANSSGMNRFERGNARNNVSSSPWRSKAFGNNILGSQRQKKTRTINRKRKIKGSRSKKRSIVEGWMIRQHSNPSRKQSTTSHIFKRHYFVLFENGQLKQYESRIAFNSGSAYPELIAELKKAKFLRIYPHTHLPHNGFEINFGFESIWLCPESLKSFEAWYEKLIIFTEERLTSLRLSRLTTDSEALSTNTTTLVVVGDEGALVRPANARDTGSDHFWYAVAVCYYDMLQDPNNLARITAYRQFKMTDDMQYLTNGRNVNSSFGSHIPSFQRVYSFLKFLQETGNPAAYSAVTCLALMRRMCKENILALHTDNWQHFFLATLNVAHKARSGGVNLENIDNLWYNTDSRANEKQSSVFEWQSLTNLNFNVEVSSIEYNDVLQVLKGIEQNEPRDFNSQ